MNLFKPFLIIFIVLALSFQVSAQHHRKVKIKTSYGKMILLLSDETPQHRNNFIKLIKDHFYDGLLFHRVIKDFMIQGGDPKSKNAKPGDQLGDGDVGYTIPPEFRKDLLHRKGALAAARQPDFLNPQKASSGCQFYIVQGKKYTDAELDQIEKRTGHQFTEHQLQVYKTIGGTPFLDGNYTVFGQLIKGTEILDKIATLPTDENDRPRQNVSMKIRLVHKFLFF